MARPWPSLERPVWGDVTGAVGDLGTVLPLAAGLILITGIDAGGFFVSYGAATLLAGFLFRLPLPIQPQKAVAAVAISQSWPAGWVYGAGLGSGIAWLLLATTPALRWIERVVPPFITQGIQLALAATLAFEGARLLTNDYRLGVVALALFTLSVRFRLTALALTFGVALLVMPHESLQVSWAPAGVAWTLPSASDIVAGMAHGGLAQLPLTLANAILATAALLAVYFPSRPVTTRRLGISTGLINIGASLTGGAPLCHGAGGLAAQHLYGARTVWKNIIEGAGALAIGILFAPAIRPALDALLGGLLLLVAVELLGAARGLHGWRSWIALAMVGMALIANIGVAFIAGIGAAYGLRWLVRRGRIPRLTSKTPVDLLAAIPPLIIRDRRRP